KCPAERKAVAVIGDVNRLLSMTENNSSLNWQIPHAVHSQKGPQIKKWKNYYKTKKQKEVTMPAP
ncbi:hypothetical protein, partial [Terrimonas alba]|uniref:hypothetical protein n=1 Tax=Terrimonas alba TaxID=3349636 RepID=UPI0035F2F4EB